MRHLAAVNLLRPNASGRDMATRTKSDPLATYNAKRDFQKTAEPRGERQSSAAGNKKRQGNCPGANESYFRLTRSRRAAWLLP